jgi:hypothetical protein
MNVSFSTERPTMNPFKAIWNWLHTPCSLSKSAVASANKPTDQAQPATPVPVEPQQVIDEPAPPPALAVPALSPLMQRVKEAQENKSPEGSAMRRRWRHCFHEAAHAFVGHHYDETTNEIEVDVPAGQRPKASMGMKNVNDVFAAVKAHGKGAKEAVESVIRSFSYTAAGELMETEVEQVFDPFFDRVNNEWDTKFGVADADLKIIVKLGQEAGFSHRNDLLQQAGQRVKKIITDHRAAYENLVIRLYDDGNIKQPELGEFLEG